MKVGDRIRVVRLPEGLPDRGCPDGPSTRLVFELSLGRTFAIADITSHGLLELEVGEVVGVASYLHSIWIEPDCVEPAEAPG